MRNTMHKKDLKVSNGFSLDIDRSKQVVVVIYGGLTYVHCWNKSGRFVTFKFGSLYPKYAEGIYILK